MNLFGEYPITLLLVGAVGLAVFLVVSGQPIGRPRPDMVLRLYRLDPDFLWQEAAEVQPSGRAGIVQPVLDDVALLVQQLSDRLRIGVKTDQLELIDSTDSLGEHYVQKLTTALIYEALALLLAFLSDALGWWRGGWPLWVWVGVGLTGFFMPDVLVNSKLAERRKQVLVSLPTLAELLAGVLSSGMGLEQAMQQVSPYIAGPLAREWQWVGQRLRRGEGLPVVLTELGHRNQIPELERLAEQLVAGHNSGTAVAARLRQLAVTLREQRLQALTAEGGRASERMFLPIVVFILIPLMGLVAAPGAVAVFGLLRR